MPQKPTVLDDEAAYQAALKRTPAPTPPPPTTAAPPAPAVDDDEAAYQKALSLKPPAPPQTGLTRTLRGTPKVLGAMTGAALGVPLAPETGGLSVPLGGALGGLTGEALSIGANMPWSHVGPVPFPTGPPAGRDWLQTFDDLARATLEGGTLGMTQAILGPTGLPRFATSGDELATASAAQLPRGKTFDRTMRQLDLSHRTTETGERIMPGLTEHPPSAASVAEVGRVGTKAAVRESALERRGVELATKKAAQKIYQEELDAVTNHPDNLHPANSIILRQTVDKAGDPVYEMNQAPIKVPVDLAGLKAEYADFMENLKLRIGPGNPVRAILRKYLDPEGYDWAEFEGIRKDLTAARKFAQVPAGGTPTEEQSLTRRIVESFDDVLGEHYQAAAQRTGKTAEEAEASWQRIMEEAGPEWARYRARFPGRMPGGAEGRAQRMLDLDWYRTGRQPSVPDLGEGAAFTEPSDPSQPLKLLDYISRALPENVVNKLTSTKGENAGQMLRTYLDHTPGTSGARRLLGWVFNNARETGNWQDLLDMREAGSGMAKVDMLRMLTDRVGKPQLADEISALAKEYLKLQAELGNEVATSMMHKALARAASMVARVAAPRGTGRVVGPTVDALLDSPALLRQARQQLARVRATGGPSFRGQAPILIGRGAAAAREAVRPKAAEIPPLPSRDQQASETP